MGITRKSQLYSPECTTIQAWHHNLPCSSFLVSARRAKQIFDVYSIIGMLGGSGCPSFDTMFTFHWIVQTFRTGRLIEVLHCFFFERHFWQRRQ